MNLSPKNEQEFLLLQSQENGIPLKIRNWTCSKYKTLHIGDENAAVNGLKKTVKNLMKKYEGLALRYHLPRTLFALASDGLGASSLGESLGLSESRTATSITAPRN